MLFKLKSIYVSYVFWVFFLYFGIFVMFVYEGVKKGILCLIFLLYFINMI